MTPLLFSEPPWRFFVTENAQAGVFGMYCRSLSLRVGSSLCSLSLLPSGDN